MHKGKTNASLAETLHGQVITSISSSFFFENSYADRYFVDLVCDANHNACDLYTAANL